MDSFWFWCEEKKRVKTVIPLKKNEVAAAFFPLLPKHCQIMVFFLFVYLAKGNFRQLSVYLLIYLTKDINVPPNSLLVTMDVKLLYTNVPNSEGLSAINDTLKNSNTPTSFKTVILTFLELILTLNNFIFNGEHYLQIKGCAMGTKCAPSYANLFMDNFEIKYIYPTTRKTKLYLRFIDPVSYTHLTLPTILLV